MSKQQPDTETAQPRSSRHFTQEDFKRVMLFFANIDLLGKTIDAMKGTPFYSQRTKYLINTLENELDMHMKRFIQAMPDIAYRRDWVNMQEICIDYLGAIYETDIGKMPEFLAFIKAYRRGEIEVIKDEIA